MDQQTHSPTTPTQMTRRHVSQLSCLPLQDLSAALATRNLQDSIGSSGADQLFTLESAELVERQSICGNLVCEAGERPTTTNGANGGTCPHTVQKGYDMSMQADCIIYYQ